MKKITSYPVLLGVLIGFAIGGAVIAVVTWFPWLGDGLGRHKRLAQGISFTILFFSTWVYAFWSQHRRRMFWASFSILLVLHVTGILLFTFSFRPLLAREWILLGVVESFLVDAFVSLSTRRSGHSVRV